jgi:polyhydroxybutyrate depolymerase
MNIGRFALLSLLLITTRALADPFFCTVMVNGTERRALVYPGNHAYDSPAPLVFAFHGFTGSDLSMATTKLHLAWPAATVVYPLGLTKYSQRHQRLVPAWQPSPGEDNNRDVLFIDALLAKLHQVLLIDDRQIFSAGISNGALFCYVLLVERPQLFAGFACVAGAADFVQEATVPRPILFIQGRFDTTVLLSSTKRTRNIMCKLNRCGNQQVEWAPGYFSYLPCASGQPVIWHQHNDGHIWPKDATTMITRFFKELVEKQRDKEKMHRD